MFSKIFYKNKKLFDSKFSDPVNKKAIGKIRDIAKIISEFTGLK